jgi:predicted kinase
METAQVITDAVRQTVKPESKAQYLPIKSVIIMLSGLPGSGKSCLSRKLAEHLPFMIIESDAVRKELFPRPSYSARESACVFRAVHYVIEDLLANNLSMIFDATNLEERYRKTVYRIVERTGARLILVNVEAPPEIVQKRLYARSLKRTSDDKSDATWAIYQKMKKTAEKINRPHYTVNTAGDINPVIDKIIYEANRG